MDRNRTRSARRSSPSPRHTDAVLSKIVLGNIAQSSLGWNATFWALVVGALLAAVICLVSWGKEKRMMEERLAAAAQK